MKNGMLTLEVTAGGPQGHVVRVRGLQADMTAVLRTHARTSNSLDAVLSVKVLDATTDCVDIPSVSGRHLLSGDQLVLVPRFGLSADAHVRAYFNPPPHPAFRHCAPMVLDVPVRGASTAAPAVVTDVFPSSDVLPENVLRFYVEFSGPMRRGNAETEIRLVGPAGHPVPDVLYRTSVELWDHEMRCLTVLFDPGRLKRGLGPNRVLGPPLTAGRDYTLVVGSGMADRSGRPLKTAFCKRFRVTEAVRRPVDLDDWQVFAPAAGTVGPFRLVFPASLDRGLLAHSIRVTDADGQPVDGTCRVGRGETTWRFAPVRPWAAGLYRVAVCAELEDVCGNDLRGAFDRDVGAAAQQGHLPLVQSMSVRVT